MKGSTVHLSLPSLLASLYHQLVLFLVVYLQKLQFKDNLKKLNHGNVESYSGYNPNPEPSTHSRSSETPLMNDNNFYLPPNENGFHNGGLNGTLPNAEWNLTNSSHHPMNGYTSRHPPYFESNSQVPPPSHISSTRDVEPHAFEGIQAIMEGPTRNFFRSPSMTSIMSTRKQKAALRHCGSSSEEHINIHAIEQRNTIQNYISRMASSESMTSSSESMSAASCGDAAIMRLDSASFDSHDGSSKSDWSSPQNARRSIDRVVRRRSTEKKLTRLPKVDESIDLPGSALPGRSNSPIFHDPIQRTLSENFKAIVNGTGNSPAAFPNTTCEAIGEVEDEYGYSEETLHYPVQRIESVENGMSDKFLVGPRGSITLSRYKFISGHGIPLDLLKGQPNEEFFPPQHASPSPTPIPNCPTSSSQPSSLDRSSSGEEGGDDMEDAPAQVGTSPEPYGMSSLDRVNLFSDHATLGYTSNDKSSLSDESSKFDSNEDGEDNHGGEPCTLDSHIFARTEDMLSYNQSPPLSGGPSPSSPSSSLDPSTSISKDDFQRMCKRIYEVREMNREGLQNMNHRWTIMTQQRPMHSLGEAPLETKV